MDTLRKRIAHRLTRILLTIPFTTLGLTACANNSNEKEPPIASPLAAHKTGSDIEINFSVSKKNLYGFHLVFMYKENDQKDRARVKKLSGSYERDLTGALISPGPPLTLRLKIIKIEQQQLVTLLDKELKTHETEISSWGGDSFSKELVAIQLPQGTYKALIQTTQAAPELDGTQVNFSITVAYRGK